MLKVENLAVGYGESQVLFDVSLKLDPGEVLALLGRNGMGKTTTVAAITGLLPPWGGTLYFERLSVCGLPPYQIAQLGVGLVPEGRQIFPTLTVEENLIATAHKPGPPQPEMDPSASVGPLPPASRAPPKHGQPIIRWRAADAGDWPRPDDQPEAADPR